MPDFTSAEKLAAIERELAYRRRVYPRWVDEERCYELSHKPGEPGEDRGSWLMTFRPASRSEAKQGKSAGFCEGQLRLVVIRGGRWVVDQIMALITNGHQVPRLLAAPGRIAEMVYFGRRLLMATLAYAAGAIVDHIPAQSTPPRRVIEGSRVSGRRHFRFSGLDVQRDHPTAGGIDGARTNSYTS